MSVAFPAPDIWMSHRVSYGETDAMGVVYYANYLHLFERARNEMFRQRGVSYIEIEKQGFYLPVREASCRYRSPVRYDDLIHVRIGIGEWRRASITCVYEVYNEDKTLLHTTGFTQHAYVNAQGRPMPVPEWMHEVFSR